MYGWNLLRGPWILDDFSRWVAKTQVMREQIAPRAQGFALRGGARHVDFMSI